MPGTSREYARLGLVKGARSVPDLRRSWTGSIAGPFRLLLEGVNVKVRTAAWVKENPFGVEFTEVRLHQHRLSAVGIAIGTDPVSYRLDYTLETRRGFVTSRLRVASRGEGWRRRLDLRRAASGAWSAATEAGGDAPLPPPGGDIELLAGALDCDLGLSPLTNSMPVLRHALLQGGGPIDFHMAWVSVPDLGVHSSAQRDTFVRGSPDQHVIRYEDSAGSFVADLTFDQDGLVVHYPELARRLP